MGYQGGGLARQITSNDLPPAEAIVATRRGEPILRERDTDTIESLSLRRRSIEPGTRRPGPLKDNEEGDEKSVDGEPRQVVVTEGDEPLGLAEEWTFPDGGVKAWSVIFVRLRDGQLV